MNSLLRWRDLLPEEVGTRRYTPAQLRAMYGPGPWQHEPDEVTWTDPATGTACRVSRAEGGHLCGYIGLDQGHKLHGRAYQTIYLGDTCMPITYSEKEGDGRWWIGFHCGNDVWDVTPLYESGLLSPVLAELMRTERRHLPGRAYRGIAWVVVEVQQLAQDAVTA